MARVFHQLQLHGEHFYSIGVKKRIADNEYGMLAVLRPPITREQLLRAEDSCLNEINIAAWGMTWR